MKRYINNLVSLYEALKKEELSLTPQSKWKPKKNINIFEIDINKDLKNAEPNLYWLIDIPELRKTNHDFITGREMQLTPEDILTLDKTGSDEALFKFYTDWGDVGYLEINIDDINKYLQKEIKEKVDMLYEKEDRIDKIEMYYKGQEVTKNSKKKIINFLKQKFRQEDIWEKVIRIDIYEVPSIAISGGDGWVYLTYIEDEHTKSTEKIDLKAGEFRKLTALVEVVDKTKEIYNKLKKRIGDYYKYVYIDKSSNNLYFIPPLSEDFDEDYPDSEYPMIGFIEWIKGEPVIVLLDDWEVDIVSFIRDYGEYIESEDEIFDL